MHYSVQYSTISRRREVALFREQVNSASYLKNLEHFNVQYSVHYTAQYNVRYSVQYSVLYCMNHSYVQSTISRRKGWWVLYRQQVNAES